MDKRGLVADQWLQEVMSWAAVEHLNGRMAVGPTDPTNVIFRRGLITHVERVDAPVLPDTKAEAHEVYSTVLADLLARTDGQYSLHEDRDVSAESPWLFGPLALLAAAEGKSSSDDGEPDDDGTIRLRDSAGNDDQIILSTSAWQVVVAMAHPKQRRSLEMLLGWNARRVQATLSELEAQGLAEGAPKPTRPPGHRRAPKQAVVDLASVERSQADADPDPDADLDADTEPPDAATFGDDDQKSPVRASALRRLIRSLE